MQGWNRWTDSDETGKPFSHCVKCKQALGAGCEPWLINKEFHRGECVLEFSICQPCRISVAAGLSEHSKESVRDFVEQEIKPGKPAEPEVRPSTLSQAELAVRFEACVSCGKPRAELDGFGISALFTTGGLIAVGPLPLLICRDCTAKMTSNISSHSRQVWGDFLGEHLDGPPDGSGFHGLI